MTPYKFQEANQKFGPPDGFTESQVVPVDAFVGEAKQGCLDGSKIVVTAWMPTPEERERLCLGAPIFLTFIGGLPPHAVSVSFEQAINLA